DRNVTGVQTCALPILFDGEVLVERERPPGIIFFNEEQDEVGGLIYQGDKEEGALMVLSFDQYKNDQVMQLRYLEGEKTRTYGLQIGRASCRERARRTR